MRRHVGLLICAALLPYLPVLSSSFLMDTHFVVPETWNSLMLGWDSLFTRPIAGGFRPLTGLTVFGTAWWFEGSEIAHRSVNYVIHAGVTLVTWRVALRLGLTPGGALFAGLLLALSPCFGFLVPWIAGRSDLLAALAAGLVFLAHVRYVEQPGRLRLTAVYMAVAFLAMSKEVGLLIPLLLFAFARGHRLKYAPMVLVTAAWVVIRAHFHVIGYDEEIGREYNPLTMVLEPDRLLAATAGTGRVLFSLLTCAFGPWQLMASGIGVAASLLGWVMFAGLAKHELRREPLALGFAAALLIPTVPFLHKSIAGYYAYSPAVFMLPMLARAVWRLADRPRSILIGVLLLTSLGGCIHHLVRWNSASTRFRDEVRPLRPLVEETIEECRAANGRPHLVQVLGLPFGEGPIVLFPRQMSPYALTGPFFPYYRTTDLTDGRYLQHLAIHWRTAELTPEEDRMATELNAVRKVIRAH